MKTTLLLILLFTSPLLIAQNVYIPDANFKAYLVGNTYINTNGDTEIQVSEASSFIGEIDCGGFNISDLTGIEAFTALTHLDCGGNQLTSLDVSQNTALNTLFCYSNQLTSLNVTQNTALNTLFCYSNQLPSLNVTQNTVLTELLCHNNQLTSLDVSQNTALTYLDCAINQLTSLDVSQNIFLEYIWCGANQLTCLNIANGNNNVFGFGDYLFSVNPSLNCIQVDDAAWSTANWTINIDPQQYFSEDCDYPSDCITTSLTELTTSKNLIQILDLMGRETTFKPNTPLIYVYDDGSTERVFTIE